MKNLFVKLIVYCSMLLAVLPAYAQKVNGTRQIISADTFAQKLKLTKHPQLVDVRTPAEYAEGHLAGAINIDVNAPDCSSRFAKLSQQKAVFVYCLAGKRGEKAAGMLQSLGFREIYNLRGGIQEWQKQGRPVVKQ